MTSNPSTPPRTDSPDDAVEDKSQVLFSSGKVYQDTRFQSKSDRDGLPSGRLVLARSGSVRGSVQLIWTATPDNSDESANDYDISYAINEIHSLKRKGNRLMVVLSEHGEPSSTLPPFVFEAGGAAVKTFLAHLQVNLASLSGPNTPSLKAVMDDFNLFVVQRGPSTTPNAISEDDEKLRKLTDIKWKLLEQASTVTSFFRHTISNVSNAFSATKLDDDTSFVQLKASTEASPARESSSTAAVSSSQHNDISQSTNAEPTSLHCREQAQFGVGTFDVMDAVSPQHQWDIPSCEREAPVTADEWSTHFKSDFTMIDRSTEPELRRRIFKGGFSPEIRAKGWMFIFGYVAPIGEDPKLFYDKKTKEYESMRLQWQSVTHTQFLYNSAFRERVERVAKDVARTDRETAYFEDNGPHIESLGNILNTWCMYNFDLGYVQGMSDMAAIILSVVDDEVSAFWCFVGLMDTEHGAQSNFSTNQLGMRKQLEDLATLIRFIDPPLMDSLEQNDVGNVYFTFRWLLVFMKREFKVEDVVTLWDSMWSKYLTSKFHLFICLAMIRQSRDQILGLDFDAMIQHFNTMAGSYDVTKTLVEAEGICAELAQRGQLPHVIREFFDTDLWIEDTMGKKDSSEIVDNAPSNEIITGEADSWIQVDQKECK